jgi:membrane-associated phospholipid phosphatase
MKRQIHKKQSIVRSRFARIQFLFTLLPALLWMGATYGRTILIRPQCPIATETCTKESVLPIDRLSIGMEDSQADFYSYATQNLSGVFAIVAPAAWTTALLLLGELSFFAALAIFGTDLLILVQTTFWNGLLTEISHLISQRPRPFVYLDPLTRGIDPAHYTSFYSGHTSFAAAASTSVFLILLARKAPRALLFVAAIIGQGLIFSTAYFRILAGRHFLTDVICGAIAGSTIAWLIVHFHRRNTDGPNLALL